MQFWSSFLCMTYLIHIANAILPQNEASNKRWRRATDVCPTDRKSATEDWTVSASGDTCYGTDVSKDLHPWDAGREYCELYNFVGQDYSLIMPKTKQFQDEIWNFIIQNAPPFFPEADGYSYHIGLKNFRGNQWQWVDGTLLGSSWANWAPGEPQAGGTSIDLCAQMNETITGDASSVKWFTTDNCFSYAPDSDALILCQTEYTGTTPAPQTTTTLVTTSPTTPALPTITAETTPTTQSSSTEAEKTSPSTHQTASSTQPISAATPPTTPPAPPSEITCADRPCERGTCQNVAHTFICLCSGTGYTGERCERKVQTFAVADNTDPAEDEYYKNRRYLTYYTVAAVIGIPPMFLAVTCFGCMDSVSWLARKLNINRQKERQEKRGKQKKARNAKRKRRMKKDELQTSHAEEDDQKERTDEGTASVFHDSFDKSSLTGDKSEMPSSHLETTTTAASSGLALLKKHLDTQWLESQKAADKSPKKSPKQKRPRLSVTSDGTSYYTAREYSSNKHLGSNMLLLRPSSSVDLTHQTVVDLDLYESDTQTERFVQLSPRVDTPPSHASSLDTKHIQ